MDSPDNLPSLEARSVMNDDIKPQLITREEILHLASLCRIAFSSSELEELQIQLGHILKQFEVLEELNTENVLPAFHGLGMTTVMRKDCPNEPYPKEQVLANAPQLQNDYLRVLPVLEEN